MISSVAHVALRTSRPQEMEAYYTGVLGLAECGRGSDGSVWLGCGDGWGAICLIPAEEAALDHVGLRLPVGLPVADAHLELPDTARVGTWDGESAPRAAAALRAEDPEGNLIQLIEPVSPTTPPAPGTRPSGDGVRPLKLGHVATRVREIDPIQNFYEEQLGFRFSDAIGDDFIFLRCNSDHHAVNFLRAARPGQVHHIAFELEDWAHTRRACDALAANSIPLAWGPGRHGPGHNLFTYHLDPDGNTIELFAGIDRMSDEGVGAFDWRPWHVGQQVPHRWDPDDLATANSWGVPPPPEFMV